jgi:uncharacterized protein YecT (DUF1311 family)/peptidoglycan hydrolase-like protein with peptidoglycan-binding domain
MIVFAPVAMLVMWTGPILYRRKGTLVPMSHGSKWVVSILAVLAVVVKVGSLPDNSDASEPAAMVVTTVVAPPAAPLQLRPAQSASERVAQSRPPSAPPILSSQAAATETVVGPSFDCSRAHDGVGATICSDAGLRRLDMEFVQAYQALRHQLGEQREALRQDAISFHQYVLEKCELPRTVAPGQNLLAGVHCVASAYAAKRSDYLSWLQGEAQQEASRDIVQHIAFQARLVAIGILPDGTQVDGVYGPVTRDALSRLQVANSLLPNGFLGDDLAARLRQVSLPQTSRRMTSAAMPSFVPPDRAPTQMAEARASPSAGLSSTSFAVHPAGSIYRGPISYPDFNGRDRFFRSYRTRIREGMRDGANFAGHLAVITIGCGTGCRFAYVADVRSGQVNGFPLGGEENMHLNLAFQIDSRLIVAHWATDDRCLREVLVWDGNGFVRSGARDVGPGDMISGCS